MRILLLLAIAPALVGQRLPTDAVPANYRIAISADLAAKEFSGEETISLTLAKAGDAITLNSLDLDITSAELISGKQHDTGSVTYDKTGETARISFARPFKRGKADLALKFRAPLGEHLRGFYLSRTLRRAYAVTQFEGTYARMMFPCFDEPAFKATFDLSVELDGADTAISNGRILSDTPAGAGRHRLVFSRSPKMSTYLVALAIGDWQCESGSTGGIPIRVCAVPEQRSRTKFALEASIRAVGFYNHWFGIRYPFGKLDLLAIPDYEWGGMENSGSIFFRDSALLQDDSTATEQRRKQRASIVSHEIAHQWFGDYVTAAWWDDIWLNEGFATWMADKPVAAWHPEWHMENDQALATQGVIATDSLGATRAIHGDPRTPDEIKEMFDGITYEKGGAVLNMLESWVGPEAFRRGTKAYLRAHANGNATSADFWKVVARVSGKPVDRIMPTFVMQQGVPLVKVECGDSGLKVSQQRFRKPGPELWRIPLCLKGGRCSLIESTEASVPATGCPFANRDARGYYRLSYGAESLRSLGAQAEASLSAPERIALVEDVWALVRAGEKPAGEFLDLARALKAERSPQVLNLIAEHLRYLGSVVPAGQAGKFAGMVREQFQPIAAELGLEPRPDDNEERRNLRASVIETLGFAGDRGVIGAANAMLQRGVDPTTSGAALRIAAANGNAALYEQLLDRWRSAKDLDEGSGYLFALAGFRDKALLDRTISLIDSGAVREQSYPSLFSSLLGNAASRDAAWTYLKAHWDKLETQVTSFGGAGAVVALGSFCTIESRDDVTQFFSTHHAAGAERALRQSIERMNNCIDFAAAQRDNITAWLETH